MRLSSIGTAPHLGKGFGCLDVRGIQMFMRVLSSSRMIRWPEGRKKLYIHVRANELLHFKPKRKKPSPSYSSCPSKENLVQIIC